MTTIPYRTPEWERATNAVHVAQKILVVTHQNPDGDAIGSALGVANWVRSLGKQVTVADDDGVPDFLRYLPHAEEVVASVDTGEFDLVISTDSSDAERSGAVGAYGFANTRTVINLDHHVTNTGFGDIHLVDAEASSAAEVVHNWLMRADVVLNEKIALPLLTGLVTDTIGFRTSSVTPKTLSVAQSLMAAGASLTGVMARTLESKSYKEFALWQRILPKARLDGQILSAVITDEDIEVAGLDEMTDAGLVGFMRTVDEAMIAVIYKQDGEAGYRISMRSKRGYNVAEVAFALGGGGHVQAAGASMTGTMDEIRAKLMPMLQDVIEKGALQLG